MTPESAIQRGWFLFPARWGYSKKTKAYTHLPLVKWGTESSNDAETIKQWREKFPDAYFCVAAHRSSITIFDVDDKNGKEGSKTVETLEFMHDEIPETLESATPSGGRHLFFNGITKTVESAFGAGVDSTVMAPIPGSNVEGKGVYKLVKDVPVADIPKWLQDIPGEAHIKKERDETGDISHLDRPSAIAEATLYLQTAPPAVKDSGADATSYKTACMVRDFGLSESVTRDLLLSVWAPRCVPYSQEMRDLIALKTENAYKYAESALSDSNVAAGFEEIKDESKGRFVSWEDLQTRPDPREWIVPGWVPKGEVSAIYGDGGTGKSLTTLQLLMAVNTGDLWLGHVTQQAKTLYVSCEDDDAELMRRAYAIKQWKTDTKTDVPLNLWSRTGNNNILVMKGDSSLIRGPFFKELCQTLREMGEGHKFVVLDTISDVFSGNINDPLEVGQFIKHFLKSICLKYDCTIVLVGHTNKQGEYSGTTGWRNSVRSLIQMKMHDNKNLANFRQLWTGKSNYSSADDELIVEWHEGAFFERSPDQILDTTFEDDCNHVMRLVREQAATGTPYGGHHTSAAYFANGCIKDLDGKPYEKDYIKQIMAELVTSGDVEIVRGQKHGNGVYPSGKV